MTSDINGTSIAIVNGTVTAIQGIPVTSAPPTIGQILQYNGTQWVPVALPTTQFAVAGAYSNSTQSLASGMVQVTNWTVKFDNTGSFSVANSNYVAPTDGYYNISGQFQINNTTIGAGAQIQAQVFLNGVGTNDLAVFIEATTLASYYTVHYDTVLFLNKNDVIDFRCFDGVSGSILNGAFSTYNYVNIFQVA